MSGRHVRFFCSRFQVSGVFLSERAGSKTVFRRIFGFLANFYKNFLGGQFFCKVCPSVRHSESEFLAYISEGG